MPTIEIHDFISHDILWDKSMPKETTPYTRYIPEKRAEIFRWEPKRSDSAPELFQLCEGILGYSNRLDLKEPPTIIVHPTVCDIQRYKPFIEQHTGLIIILEEDHQLYDALGHFDSLKRFQHVKDRNRLGMFRSQPIQNSLRLDNFLYIPTANNDPMPMWGITDPESYLSEYRERMHELPKTSWSRLAEFITSLKMGNNPHFEIQNYNPAIQQEPIPLGGGYWPDGCAGITKSALEYCGIPIQPREELLYTPGNRRS